LELPPHNLGFGTARHLPPPLVVMTWGPLHLRRSTYHSRFSTLFSPLLPEFFLHGSVLPPRDGAMWQYNLPQPFQQFRLRGRRTASNLVIPPPICFWPVFLRFPPFASTNPYSIPGPLMSPVHSVAKLSYRKQIRRAALSPASTVINAAFASPFLHYQEKFLPSKPLSSSFFFWFSPPLSRSVVELMHPTAVT